MIFVQRRIDVLNAGWYLRSKQWFQGAPQPSCNMREKKRHASSSASANLDRVWIFANPIAGKGKGQAIARALEERLWDDGLEPHVFFDKATDIPRDTLKNAPRAAIIIGGDGTLRTVADRLIAIGKPPPLLPIGLGTANLMVRHLGLNWDDQTLGADVSEAIRKLEVRQLDAGRANGQLFLLMVGVGFDAHVVHEMDRLRSGPIGWLNYLQPAALALQGYTFPPLRVELDGREIWPSAPGLAFVGNIKEYGTGFPVLPLARPDDELLDVCVLPCRSPGELVQLFLQVVAGEHMNITDAVYLKGKNVKIESKDSIPVQIDGDPGGQTPVEINLLPFRLPFVVR
jgi:diacylglycerol kinase (ATP)